MRRASLILAALLLGGAVAAPLDAQVRGQPMRPDTVRRPTPQPARPANARPDSIRAAADTSDSTKVELVEWAEPDSVMRELLARPGYIVTRYQGEVVKRKVGKTGK